jgi:hypothetical protein
MKNNNTKKDLNFKVMPVIWAKRRNERKKELIIESIEIKDFKYERNHNCSVILKYENQDPINLNSKVHKNSSYRYVNGKLEEFNLRWVVQGIDCHGNNIQLKII